MMSPITSTRARAMASAGNAVSGAFKFFEPLGQVGFPGVAARALPVEAPRPEAAGAAGVASQALGVAVDETAHQRGVLVGDPVVAVAGRRALVSGTLQLRLQQAVQTQQRGPLLERVAGELPGARDTLVDVQPLEDRVEQIL